MMTDLMRYAASLDEKIIRSLPPVEKWTPDYCGELNLIIKRDGTWIHEGTPIGRARLVRLFSTVIRREGERFYLVTPVEKLGINVEDAPFVAVLMEQSTKGERQILTFSTNVGDQVTAGVDHKITYRLNANTGERTPYIEIRNGLEALISRAVFYELTAIGERQIVDGVEKFGVKSSGVFFEFGCVEDIFGEK